MSGALITGVKKLKTLGMDSTTAVGRECQPFWRELK